MESFESESFIWNWKEWNRKEWIVKVRAEFEKTTEVGKLSEIFLLQRSFHISEEDFLLHSSLESRTDSHQIEPNHTISIIVGNFE